MITEHHLAVTKTARYYSVGGNGATADTPLRELWIVCHGYGQLAGQFVTPFARVATPARRIVAPEGLSRFYLDPSRTAADPAPLVGATWMTREDRDHEIADQIAYLDALKDTLLASEPTNGVRLRVLGFSQGVATASRWLAYGRVRPSQAILWAGSFPPDVDVAEFAARLTGVPVLLVVGTRDALASWAAADTQVRRFADAGMDARVITFDGGHRLDDATLSAIAADTA